MEKRKSIVIWLVAFLFGVLILYLALSFILPQVIKIKKNIPSNQNFFSTTTFSTSTSFQLVKPQVELKAELDSKTINKIKNLEPGVVFSARVKDIKDETLFLDVLWLDPLTNKIKTLPIDLTINPQIEIVKYQRTKEGSLEKVKISFAQIKINDFILVSSNKDKKEIIILFESPFSN